MSQFGNITKEQARVLYAALRQHDGPSMVPGLNRNQAKELTAALDALRGILLEIIDGSEAKP